MEQIEAEKQSSKEALIPLHDLQKEFNALQQEMQTLYKIFFMIKHFADIMCDVTIFKTVRKNNSSSIQLFCSC